MRKRDIEAEGELKRETERMEERERKTERMDREKRERERVEERNRGRGSSCQRVRGVCERDRDYLRPSVYYLACLFASSHCEKKASPLYR